MKNKTTIIMFILTVLFMLTLGSSCSMKPGTYELKPCPFCGSTDIGTWVFGNNVDVFCNSCLAHGPNAGGKEMVIKLWNGAKR